MKLKVAGSVLSLAAMLSVSQLALSANDDVADGHRYFVQYCASCHGQDGLGDGPVAKSLARRRRQTCVCSATNMACRCRRIVSPN